MSEVTQISDFAQMSEFTRMSEFAQISKILSSFSLGMYQSGIRKTAMSMAMALRLFVQGSLFFVISIYPY